MRRALRKSPGGGVVTTFIRREKSSSVLQALTLQGQWSGQSRDARLAIPGISQTLRSDGTTLQSLAGTRSPKSKTRARGDGRFRVGHRCPTGLLDEVFSSKRSFPRSDSRYFDTETTGRTPAGPDRRDRVRQVHPTEPGTGKTPNPAFRSHRSTAINRSPTPTSPGSPISESPRSRGFAGVGDLGITTHGSTYGDAHRFLQRADVDISERRSWRPADLFAGSPAT